MTRQDSAALTVPAVWHDTLDSTNAEAGRIVSTGAPGPCWIMAHAQTQGKGRANRSWVSPNGNFMGTRLWRVGQDLSRLALLSLGVGMVVRDIIASKSSDLDQVRTKWPNDVYVGYSKICGILIETHRAPGGDYWAAIGIGVNVSIAPDVADGRSAAKLSKTNGTLRAEELLVALDPAINDLLMHWPPSQPERFIKSWAQHAFGIGAPVRLSSGELGTFIGIAIDGAACVALDSGGDTVVHAGDLSFLSLEKDA